MIPAELRTLPNVLSLARGAAGPVALALLTAGSSRMLAAALAVMVVAELTDVADGLLARRHERTTTVGRFLDPVCDSVYHLCVFIAFMANGWMPAWMLFIVFCRDLIVPYVRTFARQAGRDIETRLSGKLKTVVHAVAQIGVVLIALGQFNFGALDDADSMYLLLSAATAASLASLLDYCVAAVRTTWG